MDDLDRAVEIVVLAFLGDPVWGPSLAKADGATAHLADFWRFFVVEAIPRRAAFLTQDATALAVWVPPGEQELSDAAGEALGALIRREFPVERVEQLDALFDRFDVAHPHDVPHATLSLLATHPDHRGRGLAQQLLAENLAAWDAAGVPSYLESTNKRNNHRYERAGYRPVGGFEAVIRPAHVTTMWRGVP